MGLFDLFRRRETKSPTYSIPTVKFDKARITQTVCAEIWNSLLRVPDLPPTHYPTIFEAAVRASERGRDVYMVVQAIQGCLPDMAIGRVREIALFLMNSATAQVNVEQTSNLGITHGIWRYSGAPCYPNTSIPSSELRAQDEAHRLANGETFLIRDGLYVDGVWTRPGKEPGCKCTMKSVIPGFI